MMFIATCRCNSSCPGLIDGKKCHYQTCTTSIMDDKIKTCRLHMTGLEKSSKIIHIPKVKHIRHCIICAKIDSLNKIKDCEQHMYCYNCFKEAKHFGDCPMCMSMRCSTAMDKKK